ncbi:MAG: penicillin-binding protein 2 [Clostridiaceae bacterium]|nr:penicillin-binding protein 2 [Clostridiaceae bacterium]
MDNSFIKRFFKDRYNIIMMLIIFAGIAIVYRLVDLQIIHGEEYYENSQYKVVLNKKIPVARGNILDRNGVPIAVNRVGYNVDIVNARLEEQELNSMLLKLYEIFERNGDNFNKSFTRYLTFEPFAFGSEAKKSSKAFQKWLADNRIEVEFSYLPDNSSNSGSGNESNSGNSDNNSENSDNSDSKDKDANSNNDDDKRNDSSNNDNNDNKGGSSEDINNKDNSNENSNDGSDNSKNESSQDGSNNDGSSNDNNDSNDINVIDLNDPKNVRAFFEAVKKRYKIDEKYTDEQTYKIMVMRYEIRNYSSVNSVLLAKDVSEKTVAEIEEKNHVFKGVTIDTEYMRVYKNADLAPHVIGYVRGIDAETYSRLKNEGYGINDIIGKTGIEYSAERELRGTPGNRKVEVDVRANVSTVIDENPAIPGYNVVLTLDMDLQRIALETLEKRIEEIRTYDGPYHFHDASAGAVVAIDVNNGEILAMASYPGYDPSIFLEGPENKAAQQAIMDLNDPTKSHLTSEFNRAISGRYAPGSTFKPVVGVAALEEGIIQPNTRINDRGYVTYDGMQFTCMDWRHGVGAHGWINLSTALATSCNVFFHEVGVMTGINNIDKWAKALGLGEKTGVELPGEIEGIRSNREYKAKISPYIWGKADTASSSIGQLYHEFTPLQLANYTATIANGGKKYKPHLIKYITTNDGTIVKETEIEYEQLPVKPETMEAVQQGMLAVANSVDGTAVNIFKDLPFKVGAKTGTAEAFREGESNNGVFICYAPAGPGSTPQIAVAVVIEHGVYGSYAAPVAKEIITKYMKFHSPDNYTDEAIQGVPVFVP